RKLCMRLCMNLEIIKSSVKDAELIEKRRKQIIQSAIMLFQQKGFHRTTTREIAKQAGFSIGTLYEYVRTKEDVLFLVYEAINDRVYNHLKTSVELNEPSLSNVYKAIYSYYRLVDDMQEEVVILYQEVKSLAPELRDIILEKERQMVMFLKDVLLLSMSHEFDEQRAELLANNIFVQRQMWAFRRWILRKKYTLNDYITYQIDFLKSSLNDI